MNILRSLICLSLVIITGCGNDRPPIAPLTGTVTIDGEPYPQGGLMFSPVEGGRPSLAGTTQEGEFEAMYVVGVPGAIIGKHKVMFEEQSSNAGPDGEEDEFKPYAPPANNYTISPKEIEVKSGGTVINFILERKQKD